MFRDNKSNYIKFSIICPVYNSELFLNECIKSVINQKYSNWELILIDDGSKDNSYSIIDSYSKSDERVKVIKQDNKGAYQSRINGFNASIGDYILFLDSDDLFTDDAFEIIYNNILYADKLVDLLLFNFLKKEDAKYDETSFNKEIINIAGTSKILDYIFCKNNIGNLCRFCIKKTLFSKEILSKSNTSRYTEDAILLLNTVLRATNMRIIPDQLYFYRTNPYSVTHNLTMQDKYDRFVNYNYILETIFLYNKNLELSIENAYNYSWLPLSYIVSSKKEKYSCFKRRCKNIRDSFVFKNICRTNSNLSKKRAVIYHLLDKKMFMLLRLYVLFIEKT